MRIGKCFHKAVLVSGLTLALELCVQGQRVPPLEEIGAPLSPNSAEIVWVAGTSGTPKSLTVYRVVQSSFQDETVNYLKSLGSFTEKHRAKPLADGVFAAPNVLFYRNEKARSHLSIVPNQGMVTYKNYSALAERYSDIDQVPSSNETLRAALDLLPKLGLREDELARRPETKEIASVFGQNLRGRIDREQSNSVKKAVSRDVFLPRQKSGIRFVGPGTAGGLFVRLGNHGQIGELSLVWRNLVPAGQYKTATQDQIGKWLRSGQAFVRSDWSGKADRIKIRSFEVFYFEHNGTTRQAEVLPYASMKAEILTGTKTQAVTILSPIITGEKVDAD